MAWQTARLRDLIQMCGKPLVFGSPAAAAANEARLISLPRRSHSCANTRNFTVSKWIKSCFMTKGDFFFPNSFGKTSEEEKVIHAIHMENVWLEVAQCGANEELKPYKLSCSWMCQLGARWPQGNDLFDKKSPFFSPLFSFLSFRGHHRVFEAWFLLVQCVHWVRVAAQLLVALDTQDCGPLLWLLTFYYHPTNRGHQRASQLVRWTFLHFWLSVEMFRDPPKISKSLLDGFLWNFNRFLGPQEINVKKKTPKFSLPTKPN